MNKAPSSEAGDADPSSSDSKPDPENGNSAGPNPPTGADEHAGVSATTRLGQRLAALPTNTIGALWILQAAFLFTIMSTLIKLAGSDLSVFQILAVRQAVMVLIVAPRIIRGLPTSLATKRPDLQVARIVFATTAMLCGFTAIIELPLADVTALSFSKTFFLTIFAIFFLGETVGIHRWGATIVGFLGVLLMLRPEGDGFIDPFALLAIIGAACAGLVMVILRILTKTDSPTTILTYQAVFVGLIMAGPAIYTWKAPSLEEWGLLVMIGVVSWAAQMSNIKAFRAGEATAIASLDYTRLLYATIIGALVFSQWPSVETLIGAGIIIAASMYTVRREAVRGRQLARAAEGRGYNN
ncbi:DMT family transporter [uncultured Roseibium sp.]|uniref:DMT family transporter n=1 Tax=uncultured Roseibium sp. TaxID=1936171 RepID=UPI0025965D7E|nr:DMT family transporter [uncultured Roseibium sp.]